MKNRADPPFVRVELNLRTLLLALGVVAAAWLFIQLWPVLLMVVVALMIVGALDPLAEWLMKHRWKRTLAVAVIFFNLLLVLALVVALTVPRVVSEAIELFGRIPAAQGQFSHWLESHSLTRPFAHTVRAARWPEILAELGRMGLTHSPAVLIGIGYFFGALFLALYLLLDKERLRGGAFALIPRRYHVRTSRILINLEVIVGGYLRGQIITSVIAAAFTFVVLTIAGVPNALALSIFAGIADVLPYVGALLACGPAFAVALSQGLPTALGVLAALVVYQEVESRFIVPQLYGKVLRLPAAIVMVALLIGGKLLGIVGALLALPIAAGIRMVVAELRLELPGEELAEESQRRRDAEAEREFLRRTEGVPASEAAAIAAEMAKDRVEQDRANLDPDLRPSHH